METSPETTIFLLRPFFIALYIGLLFSIVIFIREKAHQRKLKKENVKLKEHIQTKLEIEAETNEKVRKDIEELKLQNENLRISLQALDVKPGRSEIKQLHIYQKAVEILTEKAPGFGSFRAGGAPVKKSRTIPIPNPHPDPLPEGEGLRFNGLGRYAQVDAFGLNCPDPLSPAAQIESFGFNA